MYKNHHEGFGGVFYLFVFFKLHTSIPYSRFWNMSGLEKTPLVILGFTALGDWAAL